MSTWTEERILELATSLPAMRTIRHQPFGLRQRTCTVLKKLLQNHTRCHHQWVKRRDCECVRTEFAAAGSAWLGPTLLVRACDGNELADNEGLRPGQRRKPSIELAAMRASLAETSSCVCMCATSCLVKLMRVVMAPTLCSKHARRDTMRA